MSAASGPGFLDVDYGWTLGLLAIYRLPDADMPGPHWIWTLPGRREGAGSMGSCVWESTVGCRREWELKHPAVEVRGSHVERDRLSR